MAASEDVIHFLRHRAGPFVFSASLPPVAVGKAVTVAQPQGAS